MRPFRIYAQFDKGSIDVGRRTVTGIAQMESPHPDTQGDIVDFEASKRAFAEWSRVGNIREMHQPKAVGKSIECWADPKTKRIYVTAHISEGAEDTWKKVLDGTLSGYSIGGQEQASRREVNKTTGRSANRITRYRLSELSLVDSPAHPECVITAIHKRNGHLEATDVLGNIGAKMDLTAARTAVTTFTKSVDGNDDVIMIPKSGLELGRTDGLVVIKKSSAYLAIKKDDVAGMADPSQAPPDAGAGAPPGAGDLSNIDLEDHATNLANAHRDLCKMSGIDDHVGHYQDATEGDDDQSQDPDGTGAPAAGAGQDPNDLQMARRTGNLRKNRRYTDRDIEKRINAALGRQKTEMESAFARQIDDIKKAVGGGSTPAPRKTDATGSDGRPLEKSLGDLMGDGSQLEKGSGGRYRELVKRQDEVNSEIKTILAKMGSGQSLTSEEDIKRQQLGKEISRIEVELSELASHALSV